MACSTQRARCTHTGQWAVLASRAGKAGINCGLARGWLIPAWGTRQPVPDCTFGTKIPSWARHWVDRAMLWAKRSRRANHAATGACGVLVKTRRTRIRRRAPAHAEMTHRTDIASCAICRRINFGSGGAKVPSGTEATGLIQTTEAKLSRRAQMTVVGGLQPEFVGL